MRLHLRDIHRPSQRLRRFMACALLAWGLSLMVFPATLQNRSYSGLTYLPPGVWSLAFLVAAAGVVLAEPGRFRAYALTLGAVLWGSVALSVSFPLLTHGFGVGALPGVLIYAGLAHACYLLIVDGAK